jgi:tetratricopeptide (TPR) repeat protein
MAMRPSLLAPARSAFAAPAAGAVLAVLASAPALGQADALARGDAAWARRAEGHGAGRAAAGPIGEAIAAYEEAVRASPASLEARWKLLRALYFEGDFVAADAAAKRQVFDRGRRAFEAALDLLAARAGGRELLEEMPAAEVARRFVGSTEVARLYFWGAVHWGLWAEAFGKIAAARQGVGGRLLRYSQIVVALDPLYDDAGGHRLLGRLHAEAPRIPFFTGWVDRDLAIAELTRAVEEGPADPFNRVYLADALLNHAPSRRAEALALLRQAAAAEPRPDELVEDTTALNLARSRLAELERR